MKTKMLSACPEHLHDELRALFAQYPFDVMNPQYARENACIGGTTSCGDIYILTLESDALTLAVYLHEVAHNSLLRQGHPRWFEHNYDFVRLCRELQVRFGVSEYADHGYDQQNAAVKTTARHATLAARATALAVDYDPTQRAAYFAYQAVQADHRHAWRYALVMISLAASVIAGIACPWAQWFDALSSMHSDTLTLVSAAALCCWIWFSTR